MEYQKKNFNKTHTTPAEQADNRSETANYYNRLGIDFKDQGKIDDAIACFNQAIEHDPEYAVAYNNLGNAYKFKGDLNNAVFYYQKALQACPQYAEAYYNLGILFNECGKFQESMLVYRQAIFLNPVFVEAQFNLGNTFRQIGKLDEAIQCYRQTLKIKPDFAEAYDGLGTVYQEQGRLEKADACYQKHMRLKPDAGIQVKASLLLPVICQSRGSIADARKTLSRNIEIMSYDRLRLDDAAEQIGKTNFFLAYHGLDNRELQEQIAGFYLNASPELAWQAPRHESGGRNNDKLNIGIISRYLKSHTIGYLNHGLIKYLDRKKFHVTVFNFPGLNDDLSKDIANAADQLVILPAKLSAARKVVARQALDILLYLDIGMDPLTYFLAFSRLAAIQCTTWGHPDTTGIPHMDYYISSVKAEPPGAQAHYSEKLILFNQFPMYCHRPQASAHSITRRQLDLPADSRLYACIQSLFKVHPDFDDIISGILRRDSKGIILFFEGKHAHWGKLLRERFARRLPDVCDRVRFLKQLPSDDFMAFLQIPDVLLDTLHFSGGYTSLLAFAMGTPIVTRPGRFMRGRLTHSFYKEMDILDTVADSREAYIEIAFKLANDRVWREDIQNKIKEKSGCLYDNPASVRELEKFFLWASEIAARGAN
jgi:predicted O-linked N-acetylglucosamine transferase (SPINDLY family)